jgi:hypothetical protein
MAILITLQPNFMYMVPVRTTRTFCDPTFLSGKLKTNINVLGPPFFWGLSP